MTTEKTLVLIGAPVQSGASQHGCLMGPASLRTAKLAETLSGLGHRIEDRGDMRPILLPPMGHDNAAIHDLAETVGWTRSLGDAGYAEAGNGHVPIFLGGDHSLSLGSVSGIARRTREEGREQFVLWLDAHPDFHTLTTTKSGNLHGTPVAYFSGQPGFENVFPALASPVKAENICMMGIRSVDREEHCRLLAARVDVNDMRRIDEHGAGSLLRGFLERVRAANGRLHVSLDVDFLDPEIAPAVGTTVPGGATFREAHLIMEMLHDSGLVSSLDVVELNPFLDERGRTAKLMVDLVASLFGRRVMDRQTQSY